MAQRSFDFGDRLRQARREQDLGNIANNLNRERLQTGDFQARLNQVVANVTDDTTTYSTTNDWLHYIFSGKGFITVILPTAGVIGLLYYFVNSK